MGKLTSLQTEIINKIKYEVKKDLGYLSVKRIKSYGLTDNKPYVMSNSTSKYGHSFEQHVKNWYETLVNYSQYTNYLNIQDKEIIKYHIIKWIQKMKRETQFIG